MYNKGYDKMKNTLDI